MNVSSNAHFIELAEFARCWDEAIMPQESAAETGENGDNKNSDTSGKSTKTDLGL